VAHRTILTLAVFSAPADFKRNQKVFVFFRFPPSTWYAEVPTPFFPQHPWGRPPHLVALLSARFHVCCMTSALCIFFFSFVHPSRNILSGAPCVQATLFSLCPLPCPHTTTGFVPDSSHSFASYRIAHLVAFAGQRIFQLRLCRKCHFD